MFPHAERKIAAMRAARRARGKSRARRGATLVEFAIIEPLVFLLLIGFAVLATGVFRYQEPVFNPIRPGKVAVLVAIMLPTVLIPVLAIGVDGGSLMEDRRRLQAAVDAAALAAAAQLYRDNSTFISNNANTSQPPNTSGAEVAALDTLTQLGFEADECDFRTFTMPASSSNPRINSQPGTIEVKTTFLQPRSFSALWGTDKLKVAACAVARVKNFSQGNGIILLEESDYDALQSSGSGMLIVNRGRSRRQFDAQPGRRDGGKLHGPRRQVV